jgi:hypothetical protein
LLNKVRYFKIFGTVTILQIHGHGGQSSNFPKTSSLFTKHFATFFKLFYCGG